MTDPISTVVVSAIAKKAVNILVKQSLATSVWDGVVDLLADQANDLGKDEIKKRIEGFRSDGKLRKQIQTALENAVETWADGYHDKPLIEAVANPTGGTTFTDLPSAQQSIRTVALRPHDPDAHDGLANAFLEVLPKNFEVDRVEKAVVDLLDKLREEFATVPALQQTQAVFAEIGTEKNTARILTILEEMRRGPHPTRETVDKYLKWVVDQHCYLDPRGTMQTVRQVQVLLEEVYVSLEAEAEAPLSAADRRMYEEEIEAFMAREDLRPEEKEDLRENLLAKYLHQPATLDRKPVELSELVVKYPKLVFLGDPGAGKTTLMRYLALIHAQALRKNQPEIEQYGTSRLPLYLRIAIFAEYGGNRSLDSFLPDNICGDEHDDVTLEPLIRDWLQRGKCLILLDGLDEVIEPGQRADIAQKIDTFIRTHEGVGNRFVVTSRPAGYRSAPLSGDISHYHVRDMNEKQIANFLEQWCHAVERFQALELSPSAQDAKARSEIEGIALSINNNPGVRRLATNPLLLRILALIHRTGSRLPQRRIELYRLAADTLIRDWQLARGISENALVREADANRLLAELAAWMHQEKPAGIATEREVKEKLQEVIGAFQGKDPYHPDIESAVDDFLSKIRQHTGLFVERAPKRYGFMHLTFEEYFAARWLVAKPREAGKRIRNKLHRPRWDEPILLGIAHYGTEFPDDVSDLLADAVLGEGLGSPSGYEDVLFRDLLFTVRVMADQDISLTLQTRLLTQVVDLWLQRDVRGKYRPLQARIQNYCSSLAGSMAGYALTSLLLGALQDPNARVRDSAAKALRHVSLGADVVTGLLGALHDESIQVRHSAENTLQNAPLTTEGVTILQGALRDTNLIVRDNAARALRDFPLTDEIVTDLMDTLKDESEYVRRSAAIALQNAPWSAKLVTTLLGTMRDKNAKVRYSAVSALQNSPLSAEVVTALLQALQDNDAQVRSKVVSILRNATLNAEVVTALLVALRDESAQVRGNVVDALCNTGLKDEIATVLLELLRDKNFQVRQRAANALQKLSLPTEFMAELVSVLRDKNAQLRNRVVDTLRDTPLSTEMVTVLLRALQDECEAVRSGAALILQRTPLPEEGVTTLLRMLQDESEEVRSSAALALHSTTLSVEVVAVLLTVLQDESALVRSRAALALRNVTSKTEVVNALLGAFQDENVRVRSRVVDALRRAPLSPEVVKVLLDALWDETESIIRSASLALRNAVLSAEVVVALLGVLRDKSAMRRRGALDVLRKARLLKEGVIALLEMLQDESEEVRRGVADALRNAPWSTDVVTALLQALRDENEYVRNSAAISLVHLAHRTEANQYAYFAARLVESISLPGLSKGFLRGSGSEQKMASPQDDLFEALLAVAPPPQVS